MSTAIWWIRRDLRLADNQALYQAAQHGQVISLFIIDDRLWQSAWVGQKRIAFMLAGLRSLAEALHSRGSHLIIRQGRPDHILREMVAQTRAEAIYAEEDYSPFARARDAEAAAAVPLTLVPGLAIRGPREVLKTDGTPYLVYTPYRRAWQGLPGISKADTLPAPGSITTPEGIDSLPLPDDPQPPASVPFTAGEEAALQQLSRFALGQGAPIYGYDAQRDLPAVQGTSGLSPYLRWGMISARRAAAAAYFAIANAPNEPARNAAKTWLSELIWRDFYIQVLAHFPHVRGGSFRPEYDAITWAGSDAHFQAWCEGRTGYPIVDAAMRQLISLGWMHNRARMIVASFLTKDLHIDWRRGEQFFMQHLIDGDVAANNGGWQWAAGTGTDAAPYFRIFNPTSQGKKFDPEGTYIRRWVPELERVPAKYIHQPETMPSDVQRQAGCTIGRDYPAPIVDHQAARQHTLEAYSAAKKGD